MTRVRFWLALALLTPAAAHADPISIFIALEAVVGATVAAAVVTVGSWIVANAVYIALAYNVYSAVSARRAAKRAANEARDAYNRSLQDRTITALTAEPAERYFYGAGICGGDVVAIFTSDKVKDGVTKKDGYKHIVICTTSHRIKSIKDLLIDGVRLGITGTTGWATAGEFAKSAGYDTNESASIGATSLTLSQPVFSVLSVTATYARGKSASVAYTLSGNTITFPSSAGYPGALGWSVAYTVADTHNSTVYAEKFLGASDQAANAYLMGKVPGQWTSTDRLQGRSGVVVTLDLEESRFQGGIPRLSFDIEGRDEIFDPRDSTYKYTTNNALCIDDWLRSTRWGFGVTPDVGSTIEAANACDVSTTFDTLTYPSDGTGSPTSSSFTGPRYTLNGGWTADDDKETVLGQMAASMGGRVIDGASWMVQAGVWTAPTLTLVDGDEAGPIQVMQTGEAIDDIFNSARASYLPAGQTTVADLNPPYQNSTFIDADGRELWEVMTMPFTDHASRVRNLARIAVETARNGLVIQYPAKLKAWETRPGQRVQVTNAEFAWTSKTFRVTDWQFGLRGAVVLTMTEDAEDAWDLADAAIIDPTPNTGLPNPNVVPYITGLAVASGTAELLRLDDGTVTPRVKVTWTQSAAAYMDSGRVEVAWRNVIDTDWALVNAAGDDTTAYLLGVQDTTVILVRVTAYNSLGVASTPVYFDHTVIGKTAPPSDVTGLAASTQPGAAHIVWDQCPDADYDYTVLRYGASWAGGTTLRFNRPGTSYDWPWPTPGSYTIWAAHVDTSGNLSSTPVSTTVAVDSSILVGVDDTTILPLINAARGTNVWLGTLGGPTDTTDASIFAVNRPDPSGTLNAVDVDIETSGGYVYWRTTKLQPGYYSVKLRLKVDASVSIVVSTTDSTSWASGGWTRAQTDSTTPVWVQVTLRQLVGSAGALDVTVGAFLGAVPAYSTPSHSGASVSDLWIEREDAGIAAAIAVAATAQSTADGKIDSFYQNSAPGSFSDGYIWFDTDDGNKQYVAVSGVWVVAADTRIGTAITAAAGAQATADGKVTTFYASSAPAADAVGDLWANTTSGSTRLSRWSGSAWVVLSVIGSGDVDTPQLANSSATDVSVVVLTTFTFNNIT